ncbi:hypothetical protein IFM89_031941 [Coptis chinensis]|uniref:Uncharacterized protein n=1 Tax=Coptis chinensis TaxID=261450 RepID=A0A835MAK3_9MAGN|nr:hypothetical protein IFM89_031941 [Coptis chinensis]
MEIDQEETSSRPSDQATMMELYQENLVTMSKDISQRTKDMGLDAEGSMSREWTNEKHSLYLDSMEASFVRQLHMLSKQSNATSNQFKVLQSGSWKKISFEPAKPKTSTADDSRTLLENQWIRHFRYAGKHQEELALPNLQENGTEFITSGELKMGLSGAVHRQKSASFGATMHSKKLCAGYSHQRDQDYVSSNAEVSDQNFVDDNNEEVHMNNHLRAKKMRTTDFPIKDQVVPLRNFNENCASSREEIVVSNEAIRKHDH